MFTYFIIFFFSSGYIFNAIRPSWFMGLFLLVNWGWWEYLWVKLQTQNGVFNKQWTEGQEDWFPSPYTPFIKVLSCSIATQWVGGTRSPLSRCENGGPGTTGDSLKEPWVCECKLGWLMHGFTWKSLIMGISSVPNKRRLWGHHDPSSSAREHNPILGATVLLCITHWSYYFYYF